MFIKYDLQSFKKMLLYMLIYSKILVLFDTSSLKLHKK
jgi:hypothetical protein